MANNKDTVQPIEEETEWKQEGQTDPDPTPVVDEMVTVPKSLLDDIQKRLQEVEASTKEEDPLSIKNAINAHRAKNAKPLVRVHFIKDKMVTKYGRSWELRDPLDPNKYIQMLEVFDETGTKHEVEHAQYADQGDFEWCEVVRKDVETVIDTEGTTTKKELDKDGYRRFDSDEEVPLEVTRQKLVYVVKVRGKEVTLDASVLN